jgi:hypothetical protein
VAPDESRRLVVGDASSHHHCQRRCLEGLTAGACRALGAIAGIPGSTVRRLECVTMAEIVLRVRLTGGDHLDVTYEEPGTLTTDEVLEHVISTLAEDAGILRCRHGDRLLVLYGRGVAALEVAPRGAVL